MGLFDLFKKKEKAPQKESAKIAEDFEHLDENGNLPWGWVTRNEAFTGKIGKEYSYFWKMWLDSRNKEPRQQYEALKSFVLYLEDAEKLCKAKGECFEFWFYEILTAPDFLEKRKEELNHLTTNFDEIERNYYKKESELVDLDARVIRMLEINPGIIQADFVKMFDPVVHNEVREKLYFLEKSGHLQRTKSGRSYILHYRG